MTEAEKPRPKSSRFWLTIAICAVILIAILILLGPRLVPLAKWFVDFVLHLDVHLGELIQKFGIWIYLILTVIVFCETGLVVMPILPGDSLLFAAGGFAALGDLNLAVLLICWPPRRSSATASTIPSGGTSAYRSIRPTAVGSGGNIWNARTPSSSGTAARRS